jgi:hypothetical protein
MSSVLVPASPGRLSAVKYALQRLSGQTGSRKNRPHLISFDDDFSPARLWVSTADATARKNPTDGDGLKDIEVIHTLPVLAYNPR